ncbi:MAG: hypothetical protein LBD50_03300 [Rickettsiales bacterium]|nr:hypothetical protein [Rickettsiales bacterium]
MRKNPARWEKQIEALKLSPEHKFPGFQNSYTFGYNIKTKYEDALFNYMQKFKNFVRNIDFEQNIFQDNVANITSYKNEENNKHYANYDYRVISAAFEIVKSICLQNRDDFKKKTSPNRDGIIIAMAKLYPEQVNPLKFGMKINLPAGYQLRIGEKIPYTR